MSKILLGICGSIAAYKSAELIRLLKKEQHDVRVVMTPSAKQFIGELTLQAVSGHPVRNELFDQNAEAGMSHIELARWPDMILIAPASADIIAKLTYGFADDLLTTLCLAAKAPIFIAPAMNQQMWHQAITQQNCDKLKQRGIQFIGPETGEQACGDMGFGRMSEPDHIIQHLFQTTDLLKNKKILITAGPTRELIDPIRYISNFSSGKMGYAIAHAAKQAGAEVILISGPVSIEKPQGVQKISVNTALEMRDAVFNHIDDCDIFIGVAAIADYRAKEIALKKINKKEELLTIDLIKNPDIIAEVAARSQKPFTIGFAAQTENLVNHAEEKLQRKNLDLIIANLINEKNEGFNSDENAVTVVSKNKIMEIPLMNKTLLAKQLIQIITEQYNERHSIKNSG